MNTISVKGRKLSINAHSVHFDAEIEEIIDLNESVIVLILPEKDFAFINNIYSVKDGKITWRIEDTSNYNPNYISRPYSGIRVYEKDRRLIIVNDFMGRRFLIDPQNGKIVGQESSVR